MSSGCHESRNHPIIRPFPGPMESRRAKSLRDMVLRARQERDASVTSESYGQLACFTVGNANSRDRATVRQSSRMYRPAWRESHTLAETRGEETRY